MSLDHSSGESQSCNPNHSPFNCGNESWGSRVDNTGKAAGTLCEYSARSPWVLEMDTKDRDKKPINASFEDWICSATIYVGYSRYGRLGGHGFVIATCYDESEVLEKAIHNLDAGDSGEDNALDAATIVEEMDCWYANDPDPAVAMQKLMGKMREFQRVVDGQLLSYKERYFIKRKKI